MDQMRDLDVNFLVDTGASLVCLPMDIIERLGLYEVEKTMVETAEGQREKRLFDPVRIHIMDRIGDFGVMELPTGTQPLLGVFPLEVLDLHPNLQEEVLEGNPRHGGKRILYLF